VAAPRQSRAPSPQHPAVLHPDSTRSSPALAGPLDPEGPPVGGPMHRTQESKNMSDTMPHPAEVAPQAPQPWDPFQLMDRLDEEALRRELDGVAATDLVYVVKEGGQEVVGLSKTGVDECCMALVSQGQVIREEDLQYEVIGEGSAVRRLAGRARGPAGPGHRRQAPAALPRARAARSRCPRAEQEVQGPHLP
jgi:hypothetical protein